MFIQSTLTLALATLLAAPLAAQGHPRGGGPEMGAHREGPPMMLRGLDLTDTQKAELKALATKHREAIKPKHEATLAARKAMHEAMLDPATPVEQLKALHEKVSQAQFELALDRRAMMQASLALLTPEQKAKAEKLRAEAPKRGEGRHPGKGRGMRPEGTPPDTK